MRLGSIYIIKNKCNKKVYIGQTMQSVHERFVQHLKPSTVKKRGSYKIYNAISKYGKDNFYYEVLEANVGLKSIDELEIFYIAKYDSYKNGYNSTNGGDSKTICRIQDIKLLKELFYSKMFYKDIAKIFNVNTATVIRTLDSLNLKKKNVVTKADLIKYKHLTNIDIAKKFNVDPVTISRYFKKFDIPRGKGCNNYLSKQNQIRKSQSTIPLGSRVDDKLPLEVLSNSIKS